MIDRRTFLRVGGMAVTAGALGAAPAPPPKPAPLERERVHAFVRAAHSDLDTVKAMLADSPTLVNATWDWGAGDWESALGGAGHMGRPDIALHLLERGARIDLPVAAMLGRLDIVRAALTAFPGARRIPGPHGIPLLAHAQAGGEPAAAVVRYLESLPD